MDTNVQTITTNLKIKLWFNGKTFREENAVDKWTSREEVQQTHKESLKKREEKGKTNGNECIFIFIPSDVGLCITTNCAMLSEHNRQKWCEQKMISISYRLSCWINRSKVHGKTINGFVKL